MSGAAGNHVPVFGTDMYFLDDVTLMCKLCDVKLAKSDHSTVLKHVKCAAHVLASNLRAASVTNNSRHFPSSSSSSSSWSSEATMNYAEYKHFLERYTGRDVPDEGTLCGPYVAVCHDETVRQIRSYVTGKKIWVSIDERYVRFGDATRPDRCVRNVIVGTLEPGKPGKMFLLTVEESRDGGVSDHLRVGALLDDAMRLLWPDGIRTDDVLLFLSEPVEHLLRAIDSARAVYTKMVHVTGAPDGKHRVVERVDKPLAESIALVDRCVADELARGCGCSGLRDVLYATAGYETMRAISRIVDGQVADYVADMPEDLDAGDLPFFEYAPVTLVDLDGSYATYTNMLANAVPLYGFEIAKKTVVIQCNNTVLHGIRLSNRENFNNQVMKSKSD